MCFSCKPLKTEQEEIVSVLNEWTGKTIIMPDSSYIYQYIQDYNFDSIAVNAEFKILNYIDSLECISCNLRLKEWNILKKELSERSKKEVVPFFIFSPKNAIRMKEVIPLIKRNALSFPIVIDSLDRFNSLNHFPKNNRFHTFLLSGNNQVLVVGNPVMNAHIKKLYYDVISGKKVRTESNTMPVTNVAISSCVDMGNFAWNCEKKDSFLINNIGKVQLVVNEIVTSCGCISVDYNKEPVEPHQSIKVNVCYQAENPGHFEKTIKIYCNTENAPLVIKVKGNAI